MEVVVIWIQIQCLLVEVYNKIFLKRLHEGLRVICFRCDFFGNKKDQCKEFLYSLRIIPKEK
ncbi:hypothetical protein CR513_08382, partial [Mucuna pruriens]